MIEERKLLQKVDGSMILADELWSDNYYHRVLRNERGRFVTHHIVAHKIYYNNGILNEGSET